MPGKTAERRNGRQDHAAAGSGTMYNVHRIPEQDAPESPSAPREARGDEALHTPGWTRNETRPQDGSPAGQPFHAPRHVSGEALEANAPEVMDETREAYTGQCASAPGPRRIDEAQAQTARPHAGTPGRSGPSSWIPGPRIRKTGRATDPSSPDRIPRRPPTTGPDDTEMDAC